jgi:hypothetical protein
MNNSNLSKIIVPKLCFSLTSDKDDIFDFFHGISAEIVNLDVLLVDLGVCIPRCDAPGF